MATGRDLKQRHLPVRILAEKLWRAAFTLQDVDLDELVGNAKPRQRKADFVTVP